MYGKVHVALCGYETFPNFEERILKQSHILREFYCKFLTTAVNIIDIIRSFKEKIIIL